MDSDQPRHAEPLTVARGLVAEDQREAVIPAVERAAVDRIHVAGEYAVDVQPAAVDRGHRSAPRAAGSPAQALGIARQKRWGTIAVCGARAVHRLVLIGALRERDVAGGGATRVADDVGVFLRDVGGRCPRPRSSIQPRRLDLVRELLAGSGSRLRLAASGEVQTPAADPGDGAESVKFAAGSTPLVS